MKILVTGATGFLGKRVMEILKDKGCDPIGTGRNEAIGNHLRHAGFNFVQADLRDLAQVRRIFQKNKDIQYVVHCAREPHKTAVGSLAARKAIFLLALISIASQVPGFLPIWAGRF